MTPKFKAAGFWVALTVAAVVPWVAVILGTKPTMRHPIGIIEYVSAAVLLGAGYGIFLTVNKPAKKEKIAIGGLLFGVYFLWLLFRAFLL